MREPRISCEKEIICNFSFLEAFRGGMETLWVKEQENKDVGKGMAAFWVLPRQKNSPRHS